EHLVEAALSRMPAGKKDVSRVIDLGTGSGAVVVSLAVERPGNLYFAVDRSYPALKLAEKNAAQNGVAENIRFFAGCWLDSVDPGGPGFDIIVSNPPYVPSGDLADLEPEVSEYEPLMALDGNRDGLEAVRTIASLAPAHLKPEGFLLMEIGYDQKDAVEELCRESGAYREPEFVRDYGGHDRVAVLLKI
ncbi:MAG: N5-glutamine methyltransferase family protein, partial [Desulfosalsimonas sp.]